MNGNATDARSGTQQQYSAPETNTYYAQHDFDGPAKLSTTVIHSISEVANVDMTNTESTLFQHVDPDALNDLFQPVGSDAPRTSGQVTLNIWGYGVTVYSDGQIVITAPPRPHR